MNKLILLIALIIFQPLGLGWGGSYLLHLKNGNELRTSYYWGEGDEIRFYIYGGVAGIQRGFVTKITSSNLNFKEDITSKENMENIHPSSVINDQKSEESIQNRRSQTESKPTRKAETSEVVDFDYYREVKAAIREKFEDALRRNEEATARQDQEAKELTRKEYLEFSKQIIDLGDELRRKNKGVLPDWWQE